MYEAGSPTSDPDLSFENSSDEIQADDLFMSNMPFESTPGPKKDRKVEFQSMSSSLEDTNLMSDEEYSPIYRQNPVINTEAFTPSRQAFDPMDSYRGFGLDKAPEEISEDDIFTDSSEETDALSPLNFSFGDSEEENFAVILYTSRLNKIPKHELLSTYKSIINKRARLLNDQVENSKHQGSFGENVLLVERDSLENEEFTWDLLRSLEEGHAKNLHSDWNIHSYERNLCILRWLENASKEKAKNYNTQSVEIDETPHDTLFASERDSLPSKDNFIKLLWVCIRSGDMETAKEFCRKCNQFWRYGSLNGCEFTKIGENTQWEGNPHRNLWKYCCWQLSTQPSFSKHERALYASRCGNLLQMFEACETWQDHLWACFRVLIDSNDDIQLNLTPPPSFVQPDTILSEPSLPLKEGASCSTVEEIFTQLQNNNVTTENQYEKIQSFIIKQDFHENFVQIAQWIRNGNASPLFVRFATHLLLYYRSKPGISLPSEDGDFIIHRYITHLISQFINCDIPAVEDDIQINEDSFRMKKVRAIALYTAQLSNVADQVEVFAKFLSQINVKSEEEKETFWRYACDACLDREKITCRVYELSSERSQQTSNANEKKLDALQWLCVDYKQRDKALIRANELLCEFILRDDYESCNKLVQKILPEDTLFTVVNHMLHSHELQNSCREYFCLDIFLSSQNQYRQWSNTLGGIGSLNTLGDVATAVSRDLKERETQSLASRFIRIAQMMLRFPPSDIEEEFFPDKYKPALGIIQQQGWMIDEHEIEPDKAIQRETKLSRMRKHCIPKVVLQLEHVFSYMKDYLSIVAMADWITDQRWRLYESFTKEELRELLRRIRLASIRILSTSKDPLGTQLRIQ